MIFNPVSPNSDEHQFFPNDIHMLAREMVTRFKQMITPEKMFWSLNSLNLIISKDLYVDIWGLNV